MKDNYVETKLELDILKVKKEIEYIESQKKELDKKWYQKPQWITGFIPLIVGLLTVGITLSTGLLQTQKMLNDTAIEKLKQKETEIAKKERIYNSYIAKNDSLKIYSGKLEVELANIRSSLINVSDNNRERVLLTKIDSLYKDVNYYSAKTRNLERIIIYKNNEIQDLEKRLDKDKQELPNLEG